MPTDTSFGEVRFFEDFLEATITDIPGVVTMTTTAGACAIVAGGADGRVRITHSNADNSDVGAVGFDLLSWTAGDGYLKMEARIIISAITDYCVFVGFGDKIASGDESVITCPADVVTTGAQSDAIGILWDGEATTAQLWAVGQATDVITVKTGLGTDTAPVATTPITLGVYLSLDRKSAVFYVNGKEEHRVDANSTALVAAVDLVPTVTTLERGTAYNCDIDYLYASKGRSAT